MSSRADISKECNKGLFSNIFHLYLNILSVCVFYYILHKPFHKKNKTGENDTGCHGNRHPGGAVTQVSTTITHVCVHTLIWAGLTIVAANRNWVACSGHNWNSKKICSVLYAIVWLCRYILQWWIQKLLSFIVIYRNRTCRPSTLSVLLYVIWNFNFSCETTT